MKQVAQDIADGLRNGFGVLADLPLWLFAILALDAVVLLVAR